MNIMPMLQNAESRTRQQILQFGGIHYGKTTGDGDLSESRNLSSRDWPALSQRLDRKELPGYSSPTAIYARDKLVAVDGEALLYDGAAVGAVSPGEKQIVQVNSKICVFPDKVYYDTDTKTFGKMAEKLTLSAADVTFTEKSLALGGDPAEGGPLSSFFKPGQAIEISGCSIAENNKSIIIRAAEGNTLTFSADSLTAGSSSTDVTLERRIPDLSQVCEANNRLWGVEGRVIWASALGDPLTFYNYDGISTDSYAVSAGTGQAFTGCAAYGNNVLFWTEDSLYRMYGSDPSEYRLYNDTVSGLQAGSAKSMAVINGVLYYKGEDGIFAYAGNAPMLCSDAFGNRRYQKARAGVDGQFYYISMQDVETMEWGLWVYDTLQGIWMREDETHAVDFARLDGNLLMLTANGKLQKLGQASSGETIEWEAVLAPFDWSIPERKDYTGLYIQVELEPGAYLILEIREDSGPWRQAATLYAERVRNMSIPVFPNHCDTLQVRLKGKGRCLIRQAAREYVIGGKR